MKSIISNLLNQMPFHSVRIMPTTKWIQCATQLVWRIWNLALKLHNSVNKLSATRYKSLVQLNEEGDEKYAQKTATVDIHNTHYNSAGRSNENFEIIGLRWYIYHIDRFIMCWRCDLADANDVTFIHFVLNPNFKIQFAIKYKT